MNRLSSTSVIPLSREIRDCGWVYDDVWGRGGGGLPEERRAIL